MRIVGWGLLLTILCGGCTGGSDPRNSPVGPAATGSPAAGPRAPRYDFEGVVVALAARGIEMSPMTEEEWRSLKFGQSLMLERLATILQRHPDHQLVGIHFGKINVDNSRLRIRDRLSYVVEVAGPPDGNCLDLYDAMTGASYLGACFYAERGSPSVRG